MKRSPALPGVQPTLDKAKPNDSFRGTAKQKMLQASIAMRSDYD